MEAPGGPTAAAGITHAVGEKKSAHPPQHALAAHLTCLVLTT